MSKNKQNIKEKRIREKKTGEKQSIKETMQKARSSRKVRRGGISATVTALVIGIVILINLILSRVPSTALEYDISSTGIYDITETTTNLLDGLDKDVKITILTDPNSLDDRIQRFVEKYVGLSDHLSMEIVDTILHPSAPETYDASDNTMVVECADTGLKQVVSLSDLFEMDEMSYYYYGTTTYTGFDGEGQLTGAVNYVTSGSSGVVYTISGHGEVSLSSSVLELFGKSGITTKDLNLFTSTEMPSDCDLAIMYAPSSDLSEDEIGLLSSYLAEGGKLMVLMGQEEVETPNLNALLKSYGMEVLNGYVEDSSRCYQGNAYAIVPELSLDSSLSDGMNTDTVLVYASLGISVVEPEDENVSVTSFMETSDGAEVVDYISDETSETGYQDTVTSQGKITLGAYAQNSMTGARLTVYGCGSMISTDITDALTQIQNLTLFVNSVTANMDQVTSISIESKSMEVTYNSVNNPGMFSIVLIMLIPAIILFYGFHVWRKRRKA